MSIARDLMRKKILEEIYDKMDDSDKKLFVQLTMEDKRHDEIIQALARQDKKLEEIRKSQSWWLDFSSNIAGNAVFDGAVWLVSKLIRKS